MREVAEHLFDDGIATLRYQFPYMEQGRKRPDQPGLLTSTVRAAVAAAEQEAPMLPRIAGGKSMGGRMTSMAAADGDLPVSGIAFLGFPLHAPGQEQRAAVRSEHLYEIRVPLLFIQGTRDKLADIGLMRTLAGDLGDNATLEVVEGGDHSFNVLKSSGRDADQVMAEMTGVVRDWTRRIVT